MLFQHPAVNKTDGHWLYMVGHFNTAALGLLLNESHAKESPVAQNIQEIHRESRDERPIGFWASSNDSSPYRIFISLRFNVEFILK